MQNDVGIVPNGIGASDLDKNLVRQAHGDLSIPGYPARAHAYLIGAGCLSESDPALLCLYHTRILSGVFDDFGIFQCIQSYLLYNNSVLNDQCGFFLGIGLPQREQQDDSSCRYKQDNKKIAGFWLQSQGFKPPFSQRVFLLSLIIYVIHADTSHYNITRNGLQRNVYAGLRTCSVYVKRFEWMQVTSLLSCSYNILSRLNG